MSDTTRREAIQLARRFHETHEPQYHRNQADQTAWRDMPESYHKRVITTFELLLRDGTLQRGARLLLQDP